MNSRFLAAALFLALPAAAPIAAEAADSIKPGKWEYTITTQIPNVPQLPPGVQLPPNVQMGAGGVSATQTSCVTASDPAAELSKPRGPGAAQSRCNVEKMNRSGGTISWVTACTMPDGTSHSEGTARYSGDSMEATTKTRTSRQNGPPMEVSNHVVGRYLGPCEGR